MLDVIFLFCNFNDVKWELTPWRKKVIPPRWFGKSSTIILGPVIGMYEYLHERCIIGNLILCQIKYTIGEIIREIVAKRKPLKGERNGSRSLDDMASRISFHFVNTRKLYTFRKTKISNSTSIVWLYQTCLTGLAIKRRCFPLSGIISRWGKASRSNT
jgi:hypothetical protein